MGWFGWKDDDEEEVQYVDFYVSSLLLYDGANQTKTKSTIETTNATVWLFGWNEGIRWKVERILLQ